MTTMNGITKNNATPSTLGAKNTMELRFCFFSRLPALVFCFFFPTVICSKSFLSLAFIF